MSPTVIVEIQSALLTHRYSEKAVLLQANDTKVKVANKTVLMVDKSTFAISFDKVLNKYPQYTPEGETWAPFSCSIGEKPNPQDEEISITFDNLDPKNLYIVKKNHENKADPVEQSWQNHTLMNPSKYKIQFFSRHDRDMFYIIFRICRLLRASTIEYCLNQYDQLLGCPWMFLHWSLWKESGVYSDPSDDTDEVHFENLLKHDVAREKFRELIRINRELLCDRTEKVDVIDVLDSDIQLSKLALIQLIEDLKKAETSKRKLSRMEISRYEQKSRSIISETSAIIEERKTATKSGKRNLEERKLEELIEAQEELRILKSENAQLKKGLEFAKKGSSSSRSNNQSNLFKEATGGTEFVTFQNNEFNLDLRGTEAFTFHTPTAAVSQPPARPTKLAQLLTSVNRKLKADTQLLKENCKQHRESWRKLGAALDNGILKSGFEEDAYVVFLCSILSRFYIENQELSAKASKVTALTSRILAIEPELLCSILGLGISEEAMTQSVETLAVAEEANVEDSCLSSLEETLCRLQEEQAALDSELGLTQKRRGALEQTLQKQQWSNEAMRKLAGQEESVRVELSEVREELELLMAAADG